MTDFKITLKKTVYSQDEIDRRMLGAIKIILEHRRKRLAKLAQAEKQNPSVTS